MKWIFVISLLSLILVAGCVEVPVPVTTTAPVPVEPNVTETVVVEEVVEETVEEEEATEEEAANETTDTTSDFDGKKITITTDGNRLSPKSISLSKGDNVELTFISESGFHNLKIDEYSIATKVIGPNTKDVVTFTAEQTGSFTYYCGVGDHVNDESGTMVVN